MVSNQFVGDRNILKTIHVGVEACMKEQSMDIVLRGRILKGIDSYLISNKNYQSIFFARLVQRKTEQKEIF